MSACFALCWLGVGALSFASQQRALSLRGLGAAALVAAPCTLHFSRGVLALVAAVIACMAASSLAGIVRALTPRWYAWSLPLSACLAAAFVFAR